MISRQRASGQGTHGQPCSPLATQGSWMVFPLFCSAVAAVSTVQTFEFVASHQLLGIGPGPEGAGGAELGTGERGPTSARPGTRRKSLPSRPCPRGAPCQVATGLTLAMNTMSGQYLVALRGISTSTPNSFFTPVGYPELQEGGGQRVRTRWASGSKAAGCRAARLPGTHVSSLPDHQEHSVLLGLKLVYIGRPGL